MAQRMANLSSLKTLATTRLKPASSLRTLILSEPDTIPYEEWLVKLPLYQKMLGIELASSSSAA